MQVGSFFICLVKQTQKKVTKCKCRGWKSLLSETSVKLKYVLQFLIMNKGAWNTNKNLLTSLLTKDCFINKTSGLHYHGSMWQNILFLRKPLLKDGFIFIFFLSYIENISIKMWIVIKKQSLNQNGTIKTENRE